MADTRIKVPSELFALAESSHFEGTADVDVLAIGPDDYAFEAPVAWSVDVTNTGSALLVAGTAQGRATSACARCLEDVHCDFQGDIEGYFLVEGAYSQDAVDGGAADDEDEVGADEFDVLPADHIIDLLPLVKAALMMDAPTMPLCRQDCAGLCPTCGANLNDGPCSCGGDSDLAEFERAANPFAALADYKFE